MELLNNWISLVGDNVRLKDMTIIGTHNSCTYYYSNSLLSSIYKTQDKSLSEQLEIGVRFLDVEISVKNGECIVKCGNSYLDFNEYLISSCEQFLNEHPSEFILINIKTDALSSKVFKREIEDLKEINDRYLTNIHDDITVKELRNKIIFINAFTCNDNISEIKTFVNYNDRYSASLSDCVRKYVEVVSFDVETVKHPNALCINYTNTKGFMFKVLPIPFKSANYINRLLFEGFSIIPIKNTVLVVDFITPELSELILKNNFLTRSDKKN